MKETLLFKHSVMRFLEGKRKAKACRAEQGLKRSIKHDSLTEKIHNKLVYILITANFV